MALISSLEVRGIRSFSEERDEIIEFGTPLSVILGQNGCGKTTIIECIKFAVIGEHPPGSNKGQNFVRDPRKTKLSTVTGKVTLRFTDRSGRVCAVTRLLDVTGKLKPGGGEYTLSVKQKDAAIQVLENGVPRGITRRCADINREMCEMFGVPMAILNNVIFCHQEDSNWPLEEGKKLKEKFDAIFSTTSYIKCLDDIRKKRKEYMDEHKVLQATLDEMKQTVDAAERLERRLQESKDQLEDCNKKKEELEEDLAPLRAKRHELEEKLDEARRIESSIESKATEIRVNEMAQEDLRATIQNEFVGTRSELEREIKDFSSGLTDRERKRVEIEKKVETLGLKKAERMEFQYCLREQKSHLENDIRKHKENEKEYQEASKVMIGNLKLPSSSSAASLFRALDQSVRSTEKDKARIEKQWEDRLSEAQKKINELRDQRTNLTTQIQMKEGQLRSLTAQKKETEMKLEKCRVNQSDISGQESQINRCQHELDDLSTGVDLDKLTTEINEKSREVDGFEREISALGQEMDSLTADAANQVEMENLRNDIAKKEESISDIRTSNASLLDTFFDKSVLMEEYEVKLKRILSDLNADIELQRRDEEQAKRQALKMAAEESSLKEKIKKMEVELEECELKVSDGKDEAGATDGETLDDLITRIEESLEEIQKKTGLAQFGIALYTRFQKAIEKDPKAPCPVCKRPCQEKEERGRIQETLQKQLVKWNSASQDDKETELERLRKIHHMLLPLRDVESRTESIRKQLLKSREELSAIQERVNACHSQADGLGDSLKELQEKYRQGSDLRLHVSRLQDALRERRSLEDRLQLKERFSEKRVAGRSLAVVREEKRSKQDELEIARNKLKSLERRRREFEEMRHRLNEQKAEAMRKMQQLSEEVNRRRELEKRLKEKVTEIETAATEISSKSKELPSVTGKVKEEEEAKEVLNEEAKRENEESRRKLEDLKKSQTSLKEMYARLEEFAASKKQDRLKDIDKESEQVSLELEELEVKMQKVQQKLRDVERDLSHQKIREQELQSCLKLHIRKAELETLKVELASLEKKFQRFERGKLDSAMQATLVEVDRIRKTICSLDGRIQTLEENIGEQEDELRNRMYLGIRERYKKKFIEERSCQFAVYDCDKFYKALNWSISKYHQNKLDSLNTIIRTLWKITYKGDDIDYIQVVAEDDGTKVTSAGNLRQSFHYRVVMTKDMLLSEIQPEKTRGAGRFRVQGDRPDAGRKVKVELDMRGRCSAGQKVLASLIIRLALAKTFGSQCPVLTLDEPTTNLDECNIHALSVALGSLVREQQKKQTAAQLIVITHDRHFVERLCADARSDGFLEVSRRAKDGTTQVIRQKGAQMSSAAILGDARMQSEEARGGARKAPHRVLVGNR